MSSGIKIRQFQWGDVEQFTRLFNEISDFTGSEKECDPAFMHQFLSQPNCDPEEHCFIAELDDRIAGFVLITHERPISRAVASGGVLQEYRNKGIGRRLLGE